MADSDWRVRAVKNMKQHLLDEKIIDGEYQRYEDLEEITQPGFARDVVSVYIQQASQYLSTIEELLNNTSDKDFEKLEAALDKLKGISTRIGAHRVKIEVIKAMSFCSEKEFHSVKDTLPLIKYEFELFKIKMTTYFQLTQRIYNLGEPKDNGESNNNAEESKNTTGDQPENNTEEPKDNGGQSEDEAEESEDDAEEPEDDAEEPEEDVCEPEEDIGESDDDAEEEKPENTKNNSDDS